MVALTLIWYNCTPSATQEFVCKRIQSLASVLLVINVNYNHRLIINKHNFHKLLYFYQGVI